MSNPAVKVVRNGAILEVTLEQALRSALAFYPNHMLAPHAYLILGNMAFLHGQMDRAMAIYRDVTQRFPSHEVGQTAFFNLAKIEYLQKNRSDAISTFYRVIDERTGHKLEPWPPVGGSLRAPAPRSASSPAPSTW